MTTFVIQYLEDSPELAALSAAEVGARLRAAFERLPFSAVLVGWNVPDALLDVCAEECRRAGVSLYRWHLLLCGDGAFMPQPDWQTIGLTGKPIPGFQGKPEFTFVCPNQPEVLAVALGRARAVLQDERYQGIFLDRMRFPSPTADPESELGCFCPACIHAAALEGLDLPAMRRDLLRLFGQPEKAVSCLRLLFGNEIAAEPELAPLQDFFRFRCRSINRLVRQIAGLAHSLGRMVGLDCFSPTLAGMVGQDLAVLDQYADWIKIMSYGHALGPAGIPWEMLQLADWLTAKYSLDENDALALVFSVARLPLPKSCAALRTSGLSSAALAAEVQRAKQIGVRRLLAGLELVELPGIVELHPAQIVADYQAFWQAGADGLALSWDLRLIPLARLELIRSQMI